MLKLSPNLEVLNLRDVRTFFDAPLPIQQSREPAVFPHMKMFKLKGLDLDLNAFLLSNVYIPQSAPLWRNCTERGHPLGELHPEPSPEPVNDWEAMRHGDTRSLKIRPDIIETEIGGWFIGHAGIRIEGFSTCLDFLGFFPAITDLSLITSITVSDYSPQMGNVRSLEMSVMRKIFLATPNLEEVDFWGQRQNVNRLVDTFFSDFNSFRPWPGLKRLRVELSPLATDYDVQVFSEWFKGTLTQRRCALGGEMLEELKINYGDEKLHRYLRNFTKKLTTRVGAIYCTIAFARCTNCLPHVD